VAANGMRHPSVHVVTSHDPIAIIIDLFRPRFYIYMRITIKAGATSPTYQNYVASLVHAAASNTEMVPTEKVLKKTGIPVIFFHVGDFVYPNLGKRFLDIALRQAGLASPDSDYLTYR